MTSTSFAAPTSTVWAASLTRKKKPIYNDRIRRGHSKMELLGQLRPSLEGQGHDPEIAGFDRALKQARWTRNRAIGWLAKRSYEEGDRRTDRRHAL